VGPPLDAFSDVGFSDAAFSLGEPPVAADSPPADVPPPLLSVGWLLSPDEGSPPVSLALVELEVEPVVPVVDVFDVVDVAVVSVASFSAEVSAGGVISGVLFGVTSETLLPPHELSPKPERRTRALAPSARVRDRCGALLTR
jgi:hypothetical protein